MKHNEHNNWLEEYSQQTKDTGYQQLALGKEVGDGFRVGDVVEIVMPDRHNTFVVGDRLFISNLSWKREQDGEVCITTLDPRRIPKDHVAHGNFIPLDRLKLVHEPVTPEEEAEIVASILGG